MSQDIFTSIDPAISGDDLADVLNSFKDAIVSGLSGTSRPSGVEAGGGWIDVSNATNWLYKIYTGSADVTVFSVNLTTGLASIALAVEEFDIKRVAADTTGAILKLIKQRLATNGQVLDGDTVGEIRFIGRASDASNPIVAYMKFDSTDNMTTSAYGGTLGFYSTADGTASAALHMRFINGLVETVVPLKQNSLRLVSQNVATAASIAQLSAGKVMVEFTGALATNLQGIDAAGASQVVTLHNRSSAAVTLKHQDSGAATTDRFKLPTATDYVIGADSTATVYYCLTDAAWKLLSTSDKNFSGYSVDTFYGDFNTWTAPSTVALARLRSFRRFVGAAPELTGILDVFGTAYQWGFNSNGQLGVGDVASRSSPVAVLGGLSFQRMFGSAAGCNFGLINGAAYAWGGNPNGQLGTGDVVSRSSPVAVTGGIKFNAIYPRSGNILALSTNGTPYAWGINANGNLGVGDVVPRSAPTAVLGGLKFSKIVNQNFGCVYGITSTGIVYAWGANNYGNLGTGDSIPRSSPVAVLGGLTFSLIESNGSAAFGLTTDGTAYSWGFNALGSLGVGDSVNRSSPVAVIGGFKFKRLFMAPNGNAAYGLTTSGQLYAWGSNASGILGDGTTINRSSPVAILGGLTFTKLRFAYSGTTIFGITADGTTYAWGNNTEGQLGVGDIVSRSSPVAVLGGLKFMEVVGLENSSSVFGVQADGTVYAWGGNAFGQLGLGDVTLRSSPVAVLGGIRADTSEPSFSADLTVVGGTAYTVAINSGNSTFANIPIGNGVYKVEIEYLQ